MVVIPHVSALPVDKFVRRTGLTNGERF